MYTFASKTEGGAVVSGGVSVVASPVDASLSDAVVSSITTLVSGVGSVRTSVVTSPPPGVQEEKSAPKHIKPRSRPRILLFSFISNTPFFY